MAAGFVVSDLHLFARRSTAAKYMHDLERAMESAEVFILNGDIFDFRWSTLGTLPDSVAAALAWVKDIIERYPRCQFHFVLGNHDSLPAFVHELSTLSASATNFTVHPHYFRLGDKLFVHGDAGHVRGDPERLARYRAKFEHDSLRSERHHLVYSSIVALRLHAVWPLLISRERLARGLLSYFENVAPEVLPHVRHIYFGHTHAPFCDFAYRNWVFHNTGAMIHGTKYQILRLEL